MATPQDAELILKLYELRTEPTMRAARRFVASFNPAGFDEILALHHDSGSENNAYWRQVLSYWEMAAAFVLHDALDPDLFADANGEPFFLYAKFTPFFEQYQKAFGRPFMSKLGCLIEMHPSMQERYAGMLAMLEARRKQAGA